MCAMGGLFSRSLHPQCGTGFERLPPRLFNRCPRQLVEQHDQRSPVRDHYRNAVSVQAAAELRYSRFERFESLAKACWYAAQVMLPSLRLVGLFGPEVSERSAFPDTEIDLAQFHAHIYFQPVLGRYLLSSQPRALKVAREDSLHGL